MVTFLILAPRRSPKEKGVVLLKQHHSLFAIFYFGLTLWPGNTWFLLRIVRILRTLHAVLPFAVNNTLRYFP